MGLARDEKKQEDGRLGSMFAEGSAWHEKKPRGLC